MGFGGKVSLVGGGRGYSVGEVGGLRRWRRVRLKSERQMLALGPLCRRNAPGVDRLQLHGRGHLPDRQSRAARHGRPHTGRWREGRARTQNRKDNEQLHEYLERIYCGVRPQGQRGLRSEIWDLLFIGEVIVERFFSFLGEKAWS